ncbi:MAG: OmpA family protein [Propioniciclava sp.]|uniref:OmpA family protein n=1 Tax=Propioniciclava sp. TaxID=2038686 RepID=UPI0039E552ED
MRALPYVLPRRKLSWGPPLAAIVLLTGCTASSPAPSTAPAPSPAISTTPTTNAPSGEASAYGVDPSVVAEVRALCTPGPGKTVEDLPDVEIPAVTWAGLSVPEQRVGAKTVPALDIPAVDRPATTAEAGCLVTFDAPAGCLPAVTISAGWIPGYRIEGYTYVDGSGNTITVEPLENDAAIALGASTEQRCQVETSGQYVSAIYRPAIYRGAAYQSAAYRSTYYRSSIYDGTEVAPPVTIPGLTVPGVTLPGTSMEGASLPSRQLTQNVTAVENETAVAYEASEAVLFAYNQSTLLPDAAQALDAILADAGAKGFAGAVRVEGHTDDTGDDAPNQRLSQARAQAVADYLTGHGIAADRITVSGRGETAPAYPNDTDENRAKNRRVVIEFRQK